MPWRWAARSPSRDATVGPTSKEPLSTRRARQSQKPDKSKNSCRHPSRRASAKSPRDTASLRLALEVTRSIQGDVAVAAAAAQYTLTKRLAEAFPL